MKQSNNIGIMVMVSEMEQLLGLGNIQVERLIPGLQYVEGREYRYILNNSSGLFPEFFKKVIRYVNPPIAQNGGVVVEGCEIVIPSGEHFQAISYKGDLDGWRKQVEFGVSALGSSIAYLNGESIVLIDGRCFKLVDCQISFFK